MRAVTGSFQERRSSGSLSAGSSKLSEQQMRDLRQIFDWLDVSGNGAIEASELLVALQATSKDATLAQVNFLHLHEDAKWY